ncbi:MAG: FkbM family methyltransferase [candidate division NC10 bacterium]
MRKAVADRAGKARLHLSEENNGDHRIYDSKDGRRFIEVKCVRLDDYFRDYRERIAFIKMDIQGAGPGEIRGMSSLLERCKNLRMVVEFWPFGLKRFGVGAKEFLRLLNGHGYSLYNADERKGRVEPADIETLASTYDPEQEVEYTNLLCEKGAKRRESLSP